PRLHSGGPPAFFEERRGSADPPLPAPQFGEPDQTIGGHCRPGSRELIRCGQEFPFGFEPCAAPHTNRRILSPAYREQRTQAPLRAERFQPRAPLERAIVVA